ncbi:MAG: sigma 54-interacting transcriptional regulator [Burkholderiales bacterium]
MNHILLVDDDPGLLRLISMRLAASGYAVETAASGEQALARLSISAPQLVITDLRMDGMDGIALFDSIHKTSPTLPVIILTAHGSIPEAVDATQRGVFGFLTKPFESKVLLEQVAAALKLGGALGVSAGEDSSVWRKDIVTRSPLMEDLLSQARLVAESDASVLIYGDSGTGKELLAHAIHQASDRKTRPFVAINCGAIPENLLESELFGYTKGSFTGATQDRKGLFQAAHGGTLFLDEIGDMPLALQVKLLRVLQEKQLRQVGSTQSVPVDVRIISATHRKLEDEMAAGKFREDLYYRLNVVALRIPPLASRREDIPLLAGQFLHHLAAKYGKEINSFAPEAMQLLVSANWPGNVRQLLNVVEQAVALCPTPVVPLTLLQKALQDEESQLSSLDDAKKHFEREYLAQLLKITSGNVSQAARMAKRNRTEFYKLLKRHALDPALFKTPRS